MRLDYNVKFEYQNRLKSRYKLMIEFVGENELITREDKSKSIVGLLGRISHRYRDSIS